MEGKVTEIGIRKNTESELFQAMVQFRGTGVSHPPIMSRSPILEDIVVPDSPLNMNCLSFSFY